MKLRHFSDDVVLNVYDVAQRNSRSVYDKPDGLWVSDEDAEASWSQWCEAEHYGIAPIEHLVDLADDAKILRIDTAPQLDDFAAAYGLVREGIYGESEPAIQWEAVSSEYDGIIITPYQSTRRLSRGSRWYYGWDCASGCIWRGRAIHRVEPVLSPPDVATLLALQSQEPS